MQTRTGLLAMLSVTAAVCCTALDVPDGACTFTKRPAVEAAGKDRYALSFAVKGFCDVAVAIEDPRAAPSSRVVRYLVYGVLGPNAPEPLKKNALDQTIVWDGKDEYGRYHPHPERCRARVSLGLRATFDKVIGYHPKDTTAARHIAGLAADRHGIYVLEVSSRNQLRLFDHNAAYLRTLIPYRADLLNTKALAIPTRAVENGRTVPKLTALGGTEPFQAIEAASCLAAAEGRLAMFTKGGVHDRRRLLRFRSDGTTAGEPIEGAPFDASGRSAERNRNSKSYQGMAHIALCPDGKYVYVSGLSMSNERYRKSFRYEKPPYGWNAVYRLAWDFTDVLARRDSFVGEISHGKDAGEGKDNDHFNLPQGIATDAAGRLYVADYGNDRVQVFSPDAAYLATIPVRQPQEIAVHQRTGAIYVLCFEAAREIFKGVMRLIRLGPLEAGKGAPAVLAEQRIPLPGGDSRRTAFTPVMCLDSWSTPARVWLTHRRGCLRVYDDRGKAFALFNDFEQDVVKAGLRPHMLGGYKMNRLEVDPRRGHLYYLRTFHLMRCDPEGPGRFADVVVHGASSAMNYQDMDFSPAGRMYLRALRFIARFDPDQAAVSDDGATVTLPLSSEVPFDYGERQDLPHGRTPLRGVIKVNALPGANGFDTGFGVGPRGGVISFMTNYMGRAGILFGRENRYIDNNVLRGFLNEAKDRNYRAKLFPGRYAGAAELVMRWDAKGQPIGEDLIPAAPIQSCGIKIDAAGNIYMGIGANLMVKGRPHRGGAVTKFPPTGGRIFGEGDITKLATLPERPPDFRGYGKRDLWVEHMQWAYPGLDQIVRLGGGTYPCLCATCRFDTDLFGRSFVPKAYQFTVGVVDTNGNEVCEVGRYGNPESPLMKRGDADIGIAHCSFVAVDTDKWLYINDDGNSRIIRVRLDYRKTAAAAVGP